jgi:mannose-6-phosphate isomerase-like protein (cupin superfamily)
MNEPRRYISGLDAGGKSAILLDEPISHSAGGAAMVWTAPALPIDNALPADAPFPVFSFDQMQAGGASFMVMEYPASMGPFWHATDTTECIAMLSGEIVFMTETGEVTLRPGDVLVDRGIVHCWRNDSGAPARAAIVMLPARPVGKGRSV